MTVTWGTPADAVVMGWMLAAPLAGMVIAVPFALLVRVVLGGLLAVLGAPRDQERRSMPPKSALELALLVAAAFAGAPMVAVYAGWTRPYGATLAPDRVVLHTALRDVEGSALAEVDRDGAALHLRLVGGPGMKGWARDPAILEAVVPALEAARGRGSRARP